MVSTWARNKDSMGRKKLPPEEAFKRKRETEKKSKRRSVAKMKHNEAERKRRVKIGGSYKSTQPIEKQISRKEQYLKSKRSIRSDSAKYQQELELKRKRRKRKAAESLTNTKAKRLLLDTEPQPSTSSYDPIIADTQPNTEKLWKKTESRFFKNISDGPTHPCSCCERLWFQKSLVSQSKSALYAKSVDREVVESIFPPLTDAGQFCSSCFSHIRLGKVPPLAVSYGFKYPEQPKCLGVLNDLEERLVSLRIPFMQIKECSYDKQLGIKGTVVNVPITFDQTVSKLPKNINDTALIHVKLKKRLHFKSDYMYRIINRHKVFEAASYLMETPLYQSQDVSLDSEWFQKFESESFDPGSNCVVDAVDSESDDEDEAVHDNDGTDQGSDDSSPMEMPANEEENFDLEDIDWENDPFEYENGPNPEPAETVIQADISSKLGLVLAPGENKVPLSLVFDDLGEELSYPKIYCGQLRQFSRAKPPTYAEIIKSELRRLDRRGATPQKVLYSHQKLLRKKLLECISIQLRHKVFDDDQITAAQLRNPDFVHSLQYKNLAFKFMKNIKSSPAHWAQEKSRVCAQIRQFGFPTIFLTLSAAENRWYDLIKHLVFVHEKRTLTQPEFQTMTTTAKNELISKDPVICSLYFEHKVKELWKTFSCKEGPFGNFKITHFYQRTEFQQRGSPHFHVMLWLEGAPQFDGTNAEEVEKFIDAFMTCSGKHPFAQLQRHRHTFTCKKKTKRQDNEYCRFNIPFFPMDRTRILLPLALDDEERDPKKFKKIREFLAQLEQKEITLRNATFGEFLRRLDMSYGEYLLALRSGINRPTVFLRRETDDILINSYSPKILGLMQSNMDIQFILDEYAVVSYLVEYINKSGRGLSKLLRNCVEAVSKQNSGLKDCLTTVANQFMNAVEISSPEAAWSILELPMSKMSEDSIFIPTFRQEERTRMLKSQEVLNNLELHSRDVYQLNVIDYYTARPQSLEQVCLATFAAWYEIQNTGPEEMKLLTGNKYARLRTKPKVIQYRKYKKAQHEDEYYREQIMLFTNWRDEKKDILSKDFNDFYQANLEAIQMNRKEYVVDENLDLEEELMQQEKLRAIEENEEENTEIALTTFEPVLEYDENELLGDISLDMTAAHGKEFSVFQPTNKYAEEKYRDLYRKCNLNQHDLIQHVKSSLRHKPKERLHLMIQGAAGTGKSFLIDILEQTLIRMFEEPDQDPTHPLVLKLAPTGKAASNIKGQTLHHALGIGLSKNAYLSPSCITEYAVKYSNVKVVIIDEISMVGGNMYEKVDAHLKLFKGNEEPFGGLHVLHFGDFNQLPPVKDTPIYKERPGLSQLGTNSWRLVKFYRLNEIMRQKDDKTFAELLGRVAAGNLNDSDVTLLKAKQTTLENVPKDATLLYYSNKDVDMANKLRLNAIQGDIVSSRAYDSVSGTAPLKSKRKALKTLKTFDRTKTGNLEYTIQFKVGAKYMLTYNTDTADGLVNGAVGILKKLEFCSVKGTDNKEVKRVWLEFLHQTDIGKEKRREAIRYAIENKMGLNWTPIDRLKRVVHCSNNNAISITRNQFPLILAEAMTIHKSQGATFQRAAVGITKNLTRSLQYVALSRVTSQKGLYIIGQYTQPPPPKEDDPLLQEMKRLESNAIIPKYAFLHQNNDPHTLQIMYHNVQSLNAHYEDIAADPCTMNSDILLFAETWTVIKDEFAFKNFNHYHLESHHRKRKPCGVSIYVKEKLMPMVKNVEKFPNFETGVHVMVLNFKTKVRMAVLYAKPGASDDAIYDAIDESLDNQNRDYKTILAGDFNINMKTQKGSEFCDTMDNIYYMKLRNNPADSTTIHQTTIDCIFSTNGVLVCGVYESSFSTHLPLYVQVPWEKMKVRTSCPPEDNDPRLECGPDLLDQTGDIEWAEDDGFPI